MGDENGQRAEVFVGRVAAYEPIAGLIDALRRGLEAVGVGRSWARGQSILLKPNLVEPDPRRPHVNTHPALVRAVAEVFRRWEAREVLVAEGPGHLRDSDYVLEQSGLGPILDDDDLPFFDLNEDDLFDVPNRLGLARWRRLTLPGLLKRVDRVVSLPKLKTHHWVGATLALKNLFGLMPGAVYGWPKNVLHIQGIAPSILDIAATVRPDLAIVDGIVGMEGDGPILGTPVASGVVVVGTNLPAVDATAARLMGLVPERMGYLKAASGRLGPIAERHIQQRGEPLQAASRAFALPPNPTLASLGGA